MAFERLKTGEIRLADGEHDRRGGNDPSPAMAKALLVNTAVDISDPVTGPIPNTHEGWGRVNFTERIAAAVPAWYRDQENTFDNTGEVLSFPIGIPDNTQPVKISLAWSDAPGAVGANPALVNNLDLEVDNDGNTYLGNVFSDGWSTTGGTADALNNLENVYIQNPTGTTAVVRIRATAINGDGVPFSGDITDQDFALVCFNCDLNLIFADGFESGDVSSWSSTVP